MKRIYLLVTAIASLVIFSSCQKEMITPQSQETDLSARIQVGSPMPNNLCAAPSQINLSKSGGGVIGTLEVSNSSVDELYMHAQLSHGWLLRDIMFYIGDRNNLPRDNSNLSLEEMPYQFHLNNASMMSTLQVPIGNQAPCFDVVFWFRAEQLDFFGNPIATTTGYADGTQILDASYLTYCPTPCNGQSTSSQSSN